MIDWRTSPMCRCGHRLYDHLGRGRCNEGRHRCHCLAFNEPPTEEGNTGQ